MGVQGQDFKADLLGPNSKPSKGLRKANLSPRTKALLEEVALSEQVSSSPAINESSDQAMQCINKNNCINHASPCCAYLHACKPFDYLMIMLFQNVATMWYL